MVVSPLDFGATGDGTGDDAPAIKAAISALASYSDKCKQPVLDLAGMTYRIDTQISINTSCIIEGRGATIKPTGLNTSPQVWIYVTGFSSGFIEVVGFVKTKNSDL